MAAPATAPAPIAGAADALARLAASRDPVAWAWLLEALGPTLASIAARLSDDPASADDAVQEALLTLRDHAGAFRPRVEPDEEARRWIVRVAANAALSLRRMRRRARARDAGAAAMPETPAREGDGMQREETARIVRDALGDLGEGERVAIVLHVIGGLGYDQVAAELRCPVGTAKTRVHRGLERLRRRLGPRAQALSLAALAGLLAPSASAQDALPPRASELLQSSRRGDPPPPTVSAGASMAVKLALVAAVVLVASTPIAMRAQSHEAAAPGGSTVTFSIPRPDPHPVTVTWVDLPLGDAMAELRRQSGQAIAIDSGAAAALPITLKLQDLPLEQALGFVCRLADLRCDRDADGSYHLRLPGAPAPAVAVEEPDPMTTLAAAPEAIRSALAGTVAVELKDLSLADSAAAVSRLCGVAVRVDPSLASAATMITGSAPAETILDKLAQEAGGRLAWRNGGLVIEPRLQPHTLAPAPDANPQAPREKL